MRCDYFEKYCSICANNVNHKANMWLHAALLSFYLIKSFLLNHDGAVNFALLHNCAHICIVSTVRCYIDERLYTDIYIDTLEKVIIE